MTSANSAVSSMNWTMESWNFSVFNVSAMDAGSWLFIMWFVRPWIIASALYGMPYFSGSSIPSG